MKLLKYSLRTSLVCIGMSVLGAVAVNAQDLKAKLPTDPDVVTGKLSNGLTYYIRTNKKPGNKVELRLAVKAGAILETNEQLGLAHFMEHMNFNGSKNFPKNDLVSYLQSIGVQFGADLNAYTAFDQTVYILPIPTDKPGNLEKGFQIIEDWAHNALLTDKDIDEERGVVLEESRLGKGANDRMMKKYFPKLAEGSLYADRLPIGKDDILKHFTYDKVRSFYHDWYRPDLQSVIVVGDIDVATAKKMIEKHFAGIKNPTNEKPRTYQTVKSRTAPDAMVVTDKEATNSLIFLKYPYTKKKDHVTVGDYREGLIENMVMSMMNRRISELTQSSNPPFAFGQVSSDDLIHGYQSFEMVAVAGDEGVEKPLNAMTGFLTKAKEYGFTETELELARKDMMSNIEKYHNEKATTESRDYVEEYIRAFLDNEAFPGIENEYKYYKQMLPGIKLSEANAIIKKMLESKNTFTLYTGPEKEGMKLPSDKELLELTKKGFEQKVTKEEEKTVASSLLDSKPTAGKVTNTTKVDGFNATTYKFSNGIEVTVKKTDFKSDEILMKGVRKGGSNSYDAKDRSNVKFATEIMDAMGYGKYNPTEIEKILAGKKIEASMVIGDVNDEINCSSTKADFESMLQLLYVQIMSPRKDADLYKAYMDKNLSMVKFISANPQAAFTDTFVKTLYGNNPNARMAIPTAADFEKVNLDRAIEIYNNEFSGADGYKFFITGNFDEATMLPLLETYVGSIPSKGVTHEYKDNGVRPVKGTNTFKFNKGKEKKSLIISMYYNELPYSEELALKTKAVAEVLNIKVIEELREKMGAIYGGGFNANFSKEPYARYTLQLALPCGPENVDKLLTGAAEEIAKLKANGPDAKDLDKVKSQWIEKYRTDVKENKYWADKMISVLFWGREQDRVLNYEQYVNKLTPADIKETANKLFSGNNQFTAILYPEQQ